MLYHMRDILTLPPLEFLRSFIVFVDSANIVEAAEKLKISQPLLSKQLKGLEELIGQPLFEFSGRKKVLTSLGKSVYQSVASQLSQLESGFHQVLATQTKLMPVRIGGRKEILEDLALKVTFKNSVIYYPLSSEGVRVELEEKRIDIGISQHDIDSSRLIRKKLWSDEFVLCWNAQIKGLENRDYKEALASLINYRCLQYSEKSEVHHLLEKAKLKLQAPHTTFSDWRLLVEILKKEKAWGILPIGYAQRSSSIEFKTLPSDLNHRTQFYLYYQKEFANLHWFQEILQQIRSS